MKGTPSVTLRTGAGLRTKPEDLVAAPVEPTLRARPHERTRGI